MQKYEKNRKKIPGHRFFDIPINQHSKLDQRRIIIRSCVSMVTRDAWQLQISGHHVWHLQPLRIYVLIGTCELSSIEQKVPAVSNF